MHSVLRTRLGPLLGFGLRFAAVCGGLALSVYSAFGVVMAGSFSAADHQRLDHWRQVAYFYFALAAVGLAIAGAATLALARRPAGSGAPKSPAA